MFGTLSSISTSLKGTIKAVLGPRASNRAANLYDDAVIAIRAIATADGRLSARHFARFKNQYAGKRCVIIGNGPSLKGMDLSPLRDEITFGLNRIYLMFDHLGFGTSFYVACNVLVLEQCAEDIEKIGSTKFLSWGGRRYITGRAGVAFISRRRRPSFSRDIPRRGLWEGATVTYVAIQLAYFMGFSEVILIGVDHHFQSEGVPHAEVVSNGADPDHFDPEYFGKGFRWHLPDLETSEIAYKLARQNFERDGRRILDATVGGKLNVFPKVKFGDLFRTSR